MASLQTKVDAVKAAVSSTTTCTPATVVALKELLLPESETAAPKVKPTTRPTKTTATNAKPKNNAASRGPGAKTAVTSSGELMSSRERTVLATYVINVTIKSLTEAAKPPPPSTPSKRSTGDLRQVASRASLRRSTSAPLSPLQPRTLNRVATSPVVTTKTTKPTPPGHSTGCLSTVECARVAFAALRSAKGPVQAEQTDFQLENGMSTLVGKLLTLGLHEHALKELRILKRRLDGAPASDASATPQGIADLLEYNKIVSKSSVSTITTCQIQVLKLIAATKKPAHIESLLAVLDESHASSPLNLLSKLAKENEKEAAKAARNMASLSQLLLSLAPSVSSREDSVATEPRLSPSPSTAFRLQALAFRTQLRWWKLAGHQGNADDDVLSPFSRCIKAFARRQKSTDDSTYTTIAAAFDNLMQLFQSQKHQPTVSCNTPLASIYHLLGSAAQTTRQYDAAYRWFDSLKGLQPKNDSSVSACSVRARLLAVALKKTELDSSIDQLVREVTEGLDGSLSGTVAELNELLDSLSLTRRSVVGILMNNMDPSAKATISRILRDLLKNFIQRYPRFLRRWLGAPPGKDAPAKQVLQFDQRRQLLLQSISQVLDAALMVIKCDVQSAAGEWQAMDDVLQDCSSLLGSVSDPVSSPARTEQLGGYYVKISSLYFSKFSQLRKEINKSKDTKKQILQALNRSIDSVKDCSPAEKEKAQLPTKLELFADLCTGSGRPNDAVQTLRSICTNMAECGVLSTVADALSSQPPALAWSLSEKTSTLSRTLRSIAKLDKAWNDWTFFLPEAERAAVLEHLMHVSTGKSNPSEPLRLHDPGSTALLRIYTLEKYPIRRLRVLLHLFYQNIGDEDQLSEVISQVDQTLRQLQKKDKAEDAGLSHYMPHLQAYHISIAALAESRAPFPAAVMKDAVQSWRSMVESCRTKEDVYAVIDDPDTLLEHLQSANQLAGLRGECHLQLSMLELSIAISKACAGAAADGLISGHSLLATQYVNIGLFPQASKTLDQTKELVRQYEGASRRALVSFHLSQAEYYAEIGSTDEAMNCLSKANEICNDSRSSWAQSKSQATIALAMVSFLQSTLALQKGDIRDALFCIKSSVKMLSHDWAKLEAPAMSASVSSETSTSENSLGSVGVKAAATRIIGPQFWSLAFPLIRCLLHISSVYAHIGMFQETMYYAESAWKIAESTQSSLYKARVSAWTGSVYLKAGNLDKALTTFGDAEAWMPHEMSSSRVRFARQLGDFYQEVEEHEKAHGFFKMAEDTARLLSGNGQPSDSEIAESIQATNRNAKPTRVARATRTIKTKAPAAPKKRGPVVKAKALSVDEPSLPKDVYQASLLAAIILSRAIGFIQQKDWASAISALDQAKDLPKLLVTMSQEQVVTAMSLIGHSMEQMIQDPVFSVMQESTISFPAVSGTAERSSAGMSSPKRGAAVTRKGTKERGVPAFTDALKQAQDLLLEAHASALARSDSSTVYRISTLLQDTILILSATAATKSKVGGHPGFSTVAVDLARNITWRREQKTLQIANTTDAPQTAPATPPKGPRRSSIGFTNDMARFQKSYVEMIPKKWSVISISLSDNQHDLCLTKFQAGHSPFILRLPLKRANSRDADSEIFSFDHGRQELLDIIKLANETSHSARDFTAKGERNAWWAEREALDTRLQDLLATVETTWLGGFKGIFSQHHRKTDLLARFQKSFHQVLDGCLPSRSQVRGKKTTKSPTITLDPRILDLFIGLGDPSDPDCDFDEALNDLLYFVVDILQFHGEHNAYDEIDFDAMLVETYDALRGYHSAAKSGAEREDGAHTVLVLDKALHAFPWESMPCMEGLAVSRVPSLACLRRLITESKGSAKGSDGKSPEGHYVSATSGTYILNPSSDLKNTQSFFQSSFRSLESWTGVVKREPEEKEFEQALSTSDVLVYFGHGSGAQYVRGKTIRRLEKCRPATFLMGCSSAALTEAGEFESYGPVWNYMMAGCPAVVGTLWDVTDRDIDRFAGRAFEEWGLFPRNTFKEEKKGKGKASGSGVEAESESESETEDGTATEVSLAEAVARARTVCRFKYLNAAAVVLYGIPVYIGS